MSGLIWILLLAKGINRRVKNSCIVTIFVQSSDIYPCSTRKGPKLKSLIIQGGEGLIKTIENYCKFRYFHEGFIFAKCSIFKVS